MARSGLDGLLELIGAAFGGVLIKDGCEEWRQRRVNQKGHAR